MKKILLLWLLPLTTFAADFEWTPRMQQAYGEIIRLRLNKGKQLLAPELGRNGVANYLDDYADMLHLLLTEDRRSYEAIQKKGEERLDQLEDMDEDSPWNRCLRAEIKLHWAFIKIKFGKEVPGAWDVIKAYKLLEENAKKFPGFTYNHKALGMMHILIGSAPENYRWVTKLLGLRGNIQQGLGELRQVAAKEALFRDEAQLMEYLMQGYVLKMNGREMTDFQKFVSAHTDNLLIQFFGNSLLMKEGYGDAALAIAQNHPSSPEYLTIPFFDYHKAEILVQKGQYQAALNAYQQFLKVHTSGNFLKDTYYRQYLCYEFLGDEAHARAAYDRVKTIGEESVEADKAALKAVSKPYKSLSPTRKVLLRSRFASDGGYYEPALALLKPYTEASFTEPEEKAEYNYRKGRIYHRTDEVPEAIEAYERAIQLGEGQHWHFAPSSCLQLGYLYQARNDKAHARQYFEKAITYKKHEYKNSVDGKAKAALNEMGF